MTVEPQNGLGGPSWEMWVWAAAMLAMIALAMFW